jgi:hypothetical protein
MLGTSEHADNLFLRLSSYSQRNDRDPLEDFCSEALVWCLRTSKVFRSRFLKLTKLPVLQKRSDLANIHSQQRYHEADADSEARQAPPQGRFDIVLEAEDSSFFVAIESKVGSAFNRGQITKYLKRLRSVKRKQPQMRCALITLANFREAHIPNVTHLFWGDVHRELEAAHSEISADSQNDPEALPVIMKQFATFLKLKELAYMNIPTTTPRILKELTNGFALRTKMEGILTSLKTSKHLKTRLARKRVRYETQGDEAYLGFYASQKNFLYVGFEIGQLSGDPQLVLYVECSLKGDVKKAALPGELKSLVRERDVRKGQTWFVFTRTVGSKLNGDAEGMRGWFHETTKRIVALGDKR